MKKRTNINAPDLLNLQNFPLEDLRELCLNEFPPLYEPALKNYTELKAVLKDAKEAIALIEKPLSFQPPAGGNKLFDSLSKELSTVKDEADRETALEMANERLTALEHECNELKARLDFISINCDYRDMIQPLYALQKSYNKGIAAAEKAYDSAQKLLDGDVYDFIFELNYDVKARKNFYQRTPHLKKVSLVPMESDEYGAFWTGERNI